MHRAGGEHTGQGAQPATPEARTCALEPVHIPGSIQPHGLLFAVEQRSLRIEQASDNVGLRFGSAGELLGRDLRELLAEGSAAALDEALRTGFADRVALTVEDRLGTRCEAELHRPADPSGVLIVELSPSAGEEADLHPRLRSALARLQSATSSSEAWERACHELRALTGFERVLGLLFDEDWSGRVVAEAKEERLRSLLATPFDESEIPAQVRRLYSQCWLRLVADVDAQPSPLVPRIHPCGQPLDLGRAHLRSVSPAHIAYLHERGVTAAMSVSLIVDGKLRGLLACRHYSGPRHVSRAARDATELLAQLLSFQLHAHEVSEAAQRALQERVRSADQAKEVFIANVSHELRTPLNAITGWTSMLQAGAIPSDRVPHAIEVIARNARAQSQLVDDLIAVSGMATGQLPLSAEQLDLRELLVPILENVRLAAESRAIGLESALADGCRVLGDPGWLKQVALQLLSNALKFTPSGGVVKVSLAREGAEVKLCVSDSGRGISAEFLPRLFAPFRQQEEGPARREQGLGLGLSMVKQLVQLHGGAVSAHSDGPGRGARFSVQLPALAAGEQT